MAPLELIHREAPLASMSGSLSFSFRRILEAESNHFKLYRKKADDYRMKLGLLDWIE